MAERVGIRSRARSYRGGQPPRKLPTRGTHPPRSPCSNPTLKAFILSHTLAPYASRLTFHVFNWRRGWDSNPRSHCWDACFPSMSIRPLSHLSAPILRGGILTRGLRTSKVTVSGRRLLFGLFGSSRLSGFLVGRNKPDEPDRPGLFRRLPYPLFHHLSVGRNSSPHTNSATERKDDAFTSPVCQPYICKDIE